MQAKLLLLHGALGSAEDFEDLTPLLSNKFEVLTLNFAGHGNSELPRADFSMELFSQQIDHFLTKNGIENISIFGYSMGGFAALHFALQHPDKVNKIYTLATKFHWTKENAERESKLLNPEKIKEKIPAYALQLQKLHGIGWENLLEETAKLILGLGNNNPLSSASLAAIKNTTKLGIGDKDNMVSIEETKQAQQAIQGSLFHLFPDTLHPLNKVNKELLAQELIQFFS
jgi:pimeloyl-ACP methyl ester carboxylesterase